MVRLIAEIGDETALLGPEHVARATDVEVLHGDMHATAQFGKALDGLKPTTGFRR